MLQTNYESKTEFYCTNCAEKDQRIEELEDAIKCSNLLIKQLENQNDRLIKQRDDAEQELTLYKKALELICYYIEYEYPKKNDDIYYRKARELEMIFLNKAKGE